MKRRVFRRWAAWVMAVAVAVSMAPLPVLADSDSATAALLELMQNMAAYQQDKKTMEEISEDVGDFMKKMQDQLNSGSVTQEEVQKVIKYGKVHDTDGSLAINSKPSAGYRIGKIPEGGVCTVFPDLASGNWYWVEYNGVQGYSYGKYITLSDTKPAAGTTTKPTTTTTVSGDPVHGKIHDTAGYLTINDSAKSTANGAAKLGLIPEGGTCVVYPNKTKNGWYWVEYQGVTGYSYSKYVTLGTKHQLTHYNAKPATCTSSGKKEYWACSGCGQSYLDAAGTKYAAASALTISPESHMKTRVAGVEPTCTAAGSTEYWYCTVCGNYFSSSSSNSALSSNPSQTVPALGHNFVNGVCTRCGEKDPNYTEPVIDDPVETDEWPGVHFPRVNAYRTGQFIDVNTVDWFSGNVSEAFILSLMKGNSANTFNPQGDVTLAEAITMAARIHSIYNTGSENFVQSGDAWYQVYLDYAYKKNIINKSMVQTDVTRKATRSEFAAIFAKAMDNDGLYALNKVASGSIPDVSSKTANSTAIYKLYRAGVLTGSDGQHSFKPDSYITRAECAAIVSRMGESDNRILFSM